MVEAAWQRRVQCRGLHKTSHGRRILDARREVQQVLVIGEGFRSSSACGRSGSPWAGRDDAAQASICQGWRCGFVSRVISQHATLDSVCTATRDN
ncbi:hypothetical protein IG631_17294 [Alternaria alternata]|nr:hypothetical protein IG631_17294 [Alternaria alternata]